MPGMRRRPYPAPRGVRGRGRGLGYRPRVVELVEQSSSPPPPVVAVGVTHDAPVDRFEEVLQALAAQDHPNLDVLVVDTGTIDPSERVHAVLPAAKVHRVDTDGSTIGFGAAANVVLDLVSGAEFYVFCHDDAAPDRRAVSAMVAAAERWDADVVGPKLVEWDDPRRFTQFGLTVDKVGVALPYVQRGELDQGQHDGLRDVFAVPGAFTLVRAARFAEVGGFDEAISFLSDDLSLAWRARVAGARVVVTAAARVRHAEAFADRTEGGAATRLAARHRVRVLLTTYRLRTLAGIVPQALLLALVEAVGALVTGRPGRARAALGAWPWNLWRLPALVAAPRAGGAFRPGGGPAGPRHQVRGVAGHRAGGAGPGMRGALRQPPPAHPVRPGRRRDGARRRGRARPAGRVGGRLAASGTRGRCGHAGARRRVRAARHPARGPGRPRAHAVHRGPAAARHPRRPPPGGPHGLETGAGGRGRGLRRRPPALRRAGRGAVVRAGRVRGGAVDAGAPGAGVGSDAVRSGGRRARRAAAAGRGRRRPRDAPPLVEARRGDRGGHCAGGAAGAPGSHPARARRARPRRGVGLRRRGAGRRPAPRRHRRGRGRRRPAAPSDHARRGGLRPRRRGLARCGSGA